MARIIWSWQSCHLLVGNIAEKYFGLNLREKCKSNAIGKVANQKWDQMIRAIKGLWFFYMGEGSKKVLSYIWVCMWGIHTVEMYLKIVRCGIWYLSDMAHFLFHWTDVKLIFTYFSDRFFQSDFLDVEHQAFGSAIMESSRVEIECVSSWNPIRKQT